MQISELISSDTTDIRHEPRFILSLRQQPVAVRACGLGERDRRVINPPPIIQMSIDDPHASPEEINQKLRNPCTLIHCELWNAETENEETTVLVLDKKRQRQGLIGTLVATPFIGRDERDEEGCFFSFPDLSCRRLGRFRLKFVLVSLDPMAMKNGDKLPFRATIISEPFQAYTAMNFPGMQPKTELMKCLKSKDASCRRGTMKRRTRPVREIEMMTTTTKQLVVK